MLRILFCNIAWMDYYKGIVPGKDKIVRKQFLSQIEEYDGENWLDKQPERGE